MCRMIIGGDLKDHSTVHVDTKNNELSFVVEEGVGQQKSDQPKKKARTAN